MPRRRPPATGLSVSNALFILLISLPFLAAAQQQQPRAHAQEHAPSHPLRPHQKSLLGSLDSSSSGNPNSPKNGKDTYIIPSNERALATLAPADAAVRAAPARSSAQSAGLSSRHPARSLQDWQVEDIILLATVDGKIHARDRRTGAHRWMLEADRPMVETTYHRNKSTPGLPVDSDFIWIVEPTQDGSLYVYNPTSTTGVQKTGLSVRQLVEDLSPYAAEDPPVVYTADKTNTLLTIDAATGHILKSFSPAGSLSNDDRSCRAKPVSALEEEECESIGMLTLGRTEYTVAIQDKSSGDQICTIRYFEWTPNNRDKDLHDQYAKTMDNKYVYIQHNGGVFAVDHGHSTGIDAPITFKHKFASPVARVFDVVRQVDHQISNDAALVLLPQPIGPAGGDVFSEDKIFVNCTESGSWYALSEKMYPTVTDGASNAVCYSDGLGDEAFLDGLMPPKQRAKLVGIHPLSPVTDEKQTMFTMGGANTYPTIGGGELDSVIETSLQPPTLRAWRDSASDAALIFLAFIGVLTLLNSQWPVLKKALPWLRMLAKSSQTIQTEHTAPPNAVENAVVAEPPAAPKPTSTERKVRFPEPAEETIFHQDGDSESDSKPEDANGTLANPKPAATGQADGQSLENGTPTKPKKKATRGVRGGRKTKEKRQEQLEKQQKGRQETSGSKEEDSPPAIEEIVVQAGALQPVDIISPEASESPTVSGKLQINNLLIDMDRVIGHGSAGTCVYAGTFEVSTTTCIVRMSLRFYIQFCTTISSFCRICLQARNTCC